MEPFPLTTKSDRQFNVLVTKQTIIPGAGVEPIQFHFTSLHVSVVSDVSSRLLWPTKRLARTTEHCTRNHYIFRTTQTKREREKKEVKFNIVSHFLRFVPNGRYPNKSRCWANAWVCLMDVNLALHPKRNAHKMNVCGHYHYQVDNIKCHLSKRYLRILSLLLLPLLLLDHGMHG